MVLESYEDWERQTREIWENLLDDDAEKDGDLAARIRETAEYAGDYFGTDHPEYAASMLPGAVLLDKIGKNRDAFDIYTFCLDTYRAKAPDHQDYPETIRQMVSLGGKHFKAGELTDAEICLATGLAHFEALCETNPAQDTVSDYIGAIGYLSDLASIFRKREENEAAGRCYETCLGHYENTTGRENREYSFILGELGLINETMGDYGKAEKYYVESLDITGKMSGKRNEDYATVLYNLADFYFNVRNDLDKARLLYQDCLDILETVLGDGHYRCAWVLNNLARIHETSDSDYEKAEKYYDEALSIISSSHGERHPDFVGIAYNLALLCRKTGKFDKAEKLLAECVDLTDPAHPLHSGSLNEMALLYSDLGQYGKAVEFASKEIGIAKENHGTQSKDYVLSVLNLAKIHEKTGNYMRSWLRYRHGLWSLKRLYGADHSSYLNTKEKCRNMWKMAVQAGKSGVLSIFKRAGGPSPADGPDPGPSPLQPVDEPEKIETSPDPVPVSQTMAPRPETAGNPERDERFSRGMERVGERDFNAALAFFKEAMDMPPTVAAGPETVQAPFHSDADLYAAMGDCCFEKEDFSQAIRHYRSGLKSAENPAPDVLAQMHCRLAKCHFLVGDTESAAGEYEAAVEKNPSEIKAWFGLAEISKSRREHEETIVYCRKVTGIDKNFVQAYQFEAEALRALGRTEEAGEIEEILKTLKAEG